MQLKFFWDNKPITAYEFQIGGQTMVALSCDSVLESHIIQMLGLYQQYPYIDLERFQNELAARNLHQGIPFDEIKLT